MNTMWVDPSTPNCEKVWELILKVEDQTLQAKLSDAFADFECAWEQHAHEYHSDRK